MSQISTLYDAMHTMVAAVLPDTLRLHNAYDLADNPEHLLANGYAVVMGGAINNEEMLSGRLTITRELKLILTRRLSAFQTDAVKKGVSEKLLLEDIIAVTKAFEVDPYLNGVASPDLCYAKFVSDEGISLIEETSFIQISATFNIKYFEKL